MIIMKEYRFEKHRIYEEFPQLSSVYNHSVNLFLLFKIPFSIPIFIEII